MSLKIGFLGMGKMGNAILKGILRYKFCDNKMIFASDNNKKFLKNYTKENKINYCENNTELVKNVDVIILCVKPFVAKDILEEIKDELKNDKFLISIVAGIKTVTIEQITGKKIPLIRVMPNTPALVGEGMSVLTKGKYATEENLAFATKIFKGIGKVEIAKENLLDAVTGVSGSGPAFFYKIINDIALAGQKLGLDYDLALKLSAQTALGSAKMILNSNDNVETLIKNVTTPGGCTALGNEVLNNSDIKEVLTQTVEKTTQKAIELGKIN